MKFSLGEGGGCVVFLVFFKGIPGGNRGGSGGDLFGRYHFNCVFIPRWGDIFPKIFLIGGGCL